MSSEKTEKPTSMRLREARRDGQVARSTDFTEAIALIGVVVCLMVAASALSGLLQRVVSVALHLAAHESGTESMIAGMEEIARLALIPVLVPLAAAIVSSVAAQAAQVGLQVTMKSVVPNFQAVNPAAGLKRMFSLRTVIDLVKMLIKAMAVGFVAYLMIRSTLPLIARSIGQPAAGATSVYWQLVLKFVLVVAMVFLICGVVDIKLQTMMFMKKMKMSKDEIRREYKQNEGDPGIKGERRRLAHQLVMSAGGGASTANVVIVNPTHYAVAIRYERSDDALPLIVAKGADAAALQIRREARESGVPIVGNPPVARALFKVEIGEPVPDELLETVAVILRWIDSLGERVMAHTPHEAL